MKVRRGFRTFDVADPAKFAALDSQFPDWHLWLDQESLDWWLNQTDTGLKPEDVGRGRSRSDD